MDFDFDTTIKELLEQGIISARTYNCLFYAGYKTLGGILDNIQTPNDLMNLRNFGRKSYSEVETILNQLIWKKSVIIPENKESKFTSLGEKIVGIITKAYSVVTEGDSDVQAYLQAAYPKPFYMHELVMGKLENMLAVVEEYSLKENIEIRYSYKHFIDHVLERMEYTLEAENAIYVEYKRKSMNLAVKMDYFSYEQMTKYFLSLTAYDYLEKTYQEQVSASLSVRSKNFAIKFLPHFSDLIKYAEEPLASYRNICPGQHMMKTLIEIFQFNQKFKCEFDRVLKLTDDEIQTEFLKHDYPYLVSRQRQFVLDFMKENNHVPLFYLMLLYLRLSENRSNKIYSLMYGIFDGKKRTLYEIAEVMDLSRERCRQIANGTIEVQESALAKNDGWGYYKNLFELPFIYEETKEFLSLKEAEHLSVEFNVFASLVKLVADFTIQDVEGHSILLNNKYKDLNIPDYLDTLFSIINGKYSTDTYISVDSILHNVPESLKPVIKELIMTVATDIYKVQIINGEQLYLPQNHIDVAEELYDILAQNGKPMHVDEIFAEFKTRYPNYKYSDPLQIKPFMYKHKHIKAVGKSSHYALDSWGGVYFGCIRDLLVDLLSESDAPLHIDNLYDGVSEYYPNTTKASVAATMEFDTFQRFVEFKGGYFGLTAKSYSDEYVVATSVQRYRFEDRFQMFKDFIDTYHRFPGYNGSDQESSLMRWYYNVTTGILSITEEQKKMLDDIVKHYDELGYPRSATENEFLIKCQDVKDYIRQNHTLPTNSNAPELHAWLRRSRDNYDSFTDKRRQYMTDLLNYILSFGFSI